ncbi:hypothetical protein LR48_Vigan07g004400 [Vigna angularis]|uniref:Methyltransferase type 11 domain-containing protein n=1 Tax=Phaseolus angularis TaxID=3914 RepID=A0A0L9UTY3_PHAAN|nr:hypothetical protein LR48_Vigan07g004400 [Vigna angularis]
MRVAYSVPGEWYLVPLLRIFLNSSVFGSHEGIRFQRSEKVGEVVVFGYVAVVLRTIGDRSLLLYDAGHTTITNVDFSKVVISDMLRRNVRDHPLMRWRVMDITAMQFEDESFIVVIDKGGLDALMEPELGPKLRNQNALVLKLN